MRVGPEVDAAVCTNGIANPGAEVIEGHDHSTPAGVARRTGQIDGDTLETFTRKRNYELYTSKGLPVPPPTAESQRRMKQEFLQNLICVPAIAATRCTK